MLTRDLNRYEDVEDISEGEEELFSVSEGEDRLREKDLIRRRNVANPIEEETYTRKREILDPRRKYEERTLKEAPIHKKLVGENRRIGEKELSYNIKIDENEVDELIEDFEDFSDKYLRKTKKERKALMKKLN